MQSLEGNADFLERELQVGRRGDSKPAVALFAELRGTAELSRPARF
jgi:hypothetical protein